MKYPVTLLTVIVFLLGLWPAALNAASKKNFDQDFLRAKESYERLENSRSAQRSHRDRWERVIESLQGFSDLHPRHLRAAEARFLSARAAESIYQISRLKSDALTAVEYYVQAVRDYPESRFTPDALLGAAKLCETPLADLSGAYGHYAQFIEFYPRHAKAGEVRGKLKALSEYAPTPPPKVVVQASSAAPATGSQPSSTTPGILTRIRSWSNPGYTRIVLDLTQGTDFSANLLPADEQTGAPRRLYIDLPKTSPVGGLPESSIVNDGLLRQIRTGRPVPGKTRVVLDLLSLGGYKIFTLPEPYRIVIDITGNTAAVIPTTSAAPVLSLPTPPKEPAAVVVATPRPEPQPIVPAATVTTPLPDASVVAKTTPLAATAAPVVTPSPVLPPVAPAAVAVVPPAPEKPLVAAPPTPPPTPAGDKIDAIIAAVPAEVPQKIVTPANPAVFRKIVIDAGHGGKDPGAVGPSGLYEKDVTLAMARMLAKAISAELGWETILTRDEDVFIPLEERTAIANKVGADLFLSIHTNASPKKSVQGIETYYLNFSKNEKAAAVAARENGTSLRQVGDLEQILFDLMAHSKIEESSRLANDIQTALVDNMGRHYGEVRDLGVKQGPFFVLLGANMPSVLVETAFISNPAEEARLASQKYQKEATKAILDGLRSYAGSLRLVAKQ